MSFISINDYKTVCTAYELEVITPLEADRLAAEASAMEQVASYLRSRYDIATAFAATGAERNPMLVQACVNITLWLMVHRLPQNMGHERRECLYQDVITWLRDVQTGKASPDLPTYQGPEGEDTHSPIRYGSMPKNTYDF